tara:strand:+ start:177 stop:449 length:273 start_codon:yes stop_codon:yes gene_type:complete
MKTVHLIVSGKVQNVGYRYYTIENAQSMGLTGWVRNLSNGSVEIRATGQDEEIGEFLRLVRRGPSYSRVSEVVMFEEPTTEEDQEYFHIK